MHLLKTNHPGSRTKLTSTAVAAMAIGLLMSACSEDPNAHNRAGVDYASHLISHHAQTLQILDLSLGREELTSKAGALADKTRAKRWDEVAVARKWLKRWGEPVPKTALEHSHSDEPPEYDTSIPGVLTHEQMLTLQTQKSQRFLRDWLNALIRNEQGAAEIAAKAAARAENEEVAEFAEEDQQRHQRQVERLRSLLS